MMKWLVVLLTLLLIPAHANAAIASGPQCQATSLVLVGIDMAENNRAFRVEKTDCDFLEIGKVYISKNAAADALAQLVPGTSFEAGIEKLSAPSPQGVDYFLIWSLQNSVSFQTDAQPME